MVVYENSISLMPTVNKIAGICRFLSLRLSLNELALLGTKTMRLDLLFVILLVFNYPYFL